MTPTNVTLSAIHSSVALVLSELPAIPKNSNAPGSMGGYAFRSIEDITAALKPLLAKHGLSIVPRVVERRDSLRPIGNNRQMFVVDLHVEFTFYAEDGSSFVASMWGEGTDMGDKATQKAVTSAFKSMLTVTFCISDADSESFEVPVTVHSPAALGDSSGAGSSSRLSPPQDDDPAPIASANRLLTLQAKLRSMQGTGFKVDGHRRAAGLPLLNDDCSPDELERWAALLNEHDNDLTRVPV